MQGAIKMERKTEYTLREVANILKVEIETIRTHVKRKVLQTRKELRLTEYIKPHSERRLRKRLRPVHIVSLNAFMKYKKLMKLRNLCK